MQRSIDVGVPSLQIAYSDVGALASVLEEHAIHTVISCVGYHGDSLKIAQKNAIKAAIACPTTKRFVPSTFAIAYPKEYLTHSNSLFGLC